MHEWDMNRCLEEGNSPGWIFPSSSCKVFKLHYGHEKQTERGLVKNTPRPEAKSISVSRLGMQNVHSIYFKHTLHEHRERERKKILPLYYHIIIRTERQTWCVYVFVCLLAHLIKLIEQFNKWWLIMSSRYLYVKNIKYNWTILIKKILVRSYVDII